MQNSEQMNNTALIQKYFPELTTTQISQFEQLGALYQEWNAKINVISRKDMDALYERHILHALGIAKIITFKAGTKVLDVGTGGGFPGIPLAILFPETQFHLVDAIGKKIKVVDAVVEACGLKNVTTAHARAEKVKDTYDFVVSRAVTKMPDFVKWVRNKIAKKSTHSLKNGILYLKGGDLAEELKTYTNVTLYNLSDYYDLPFYKTKKVVHLPIKVRN